MNSRSKVVSRLNYTRDESRFQRFDFFAGDRRPGALPQARNDQAPSALNKMQTGSFGRAGAQDGVIKGVEEELFLISAGAL